MIKNLSISVITPSFNQGAFIDRTIQSALSQNITDLEYWIIDGESTDETVSILEKYKTQQKLNFISEKDHGQAEAVNKGLKRATGDIIGWLNSDDIYYPETLEIVLDFFEKNPKANIMYGKAVHIDAHNKILNTYPTCAFDISFLKEKCILCQPAVFFRRTILKKYGFLDENLHFCLDYEFWLRLALQGELFYYCDHAVFAGSRLHGNCKTVKYRLKAYLEAMHMLKQKLGSVPESWLLRYGYIKAMHIFQRKNIFSKICGFFIAYYAQWKWNRTLCSKRFFSTLFKHLNDAPLLDL